MTTAYWCVLAALILPYCFTLISKFTGRMPLKANAGVRDWQDKLADGVARRAHWAQLNSFEVTPAFAAAVIIAHQVGTAAQGTIDQLAIAFVISRVVFGILYLQNLPTLRTLVWTLGMALIVSFFVVSA